MKIQQACGREPKSIQFLDLPKDVRLMIYERLPRTIKHVTFKTSSTTTLPDRANLEVTLVVRSTPTSILATCWKIYDEAHNIVKKAVEHWVLDGGVKLIYDNELPSTSAIEIIISAALEQCYAMMAVKKDNVPKAGSKWKEEWKRSAEKYENAWEGISDSSEQYLWGKEEKESGRLINREIHNPTSYNVLDPDQMSNMLLARLRNISAGHLFVFGIQPGSERNREVDMSFSEHICKIQDFVNKAAHCFLHGKPELNPHAPTKIQTMNVERVVRLDWKEVADIKNAPNVNDSLLAQIWDASQDMWILIEALKKRGCGVSIVGALRMSDPLTKVIVPRFDDHFQHYSKQLEANAGVKLATEMSAEEWDNEWLE